MTSSRAVWFESHLLNERAGRRARDAAVRLGESIHGELLAIGDRLARESPAVAQQFYLHAAHVRERLGAAEFVVWLSLGEGLLQRGANARDAALTYFSLPSRSIARAGTPLLAAWCRIGGEVAAVSRKLGTLFFERTAALLPRCDVDTLAVCAAQVPRLHEACGWRGEFLAQAYLNALPWVLRSLTADELPCWVDVALAVQPATRDGDFFAAQPEALAVLSGGERRQLFAFLRDVAAAAPAVALSTYRDLPAAVRPFHRATRAQLLAVLAAAGREIADQLPPIVPVLGALVYDLRQHRRIALALAARVARQFPRGTVPLLRTLPAAYEEVQPPAVEQWIERGLTIAAANPAAGEAFFALESRTSRNVLHASSTSAELTQLQGMLRKYVHMLSGRAAAVRGSDGFILRPPLEEFSDEDAVAFPLKIDLFATHEDNSRLYAFIAALLAGRREWDTYIAPPDDGSDSLAAWVRAPQRPPLLEDLFLVFDGLRIVGALARAYPGLAQEHRAVMQLFVAALPLAPAPSQRMMFDALLAALIADVAPAQLPEWLQTLAAVAAACAAPLRHPDATAGDALAIAEQLARELESPATSRGDAVGADILLSQVSPEALYDPYYDDDALASDSAPFVETAGASPDTEPPEDLRVELDPTTDDPVGASAPLSADDLRRLLESNANLRIQQGYGDDSEGLGLYITDLMGKLPADQLEQLRRMLDGPQRHERAAPKRWLDRRADGTAFFYDEWDYHISDYRQRWCCLRELALDGDAGEFFNRTLLDYATLIPEVRRQFQRIRPEMYRVIRGLEDGEDFDLNAVINARVDRRARRSASAKYYVARAREERDVATLFLIDMSASTDEPVIKLAPPSDDNDDDLLVRRPPRRAPKPRRIIDITKEALVVMAAALEEIGDAYAIYGFSGHGRDNVEFYLVKGFTEPLTASVKGRIGAIEPKRSTRMGTALRHATEKMAALTSRSRHIILLSDGFPQDFDYGQDRRSNVYGLRDTSVALREAEASGITPFCITVDKAGHDYLRDMCDTSRYMVIEDIAALPRELPKIYQRLVTA